MKIKIFLIVMFLNLLSCSVFSQGKVKLIVIDLYIEKTTIHSLVFARIQEAIRVVSEKIILGKDTESLLASKGAIEETLQNVFSQTMSGFSVSSVKLNIGEITGISVYLIPSTQIVHNVKIDVVCPQLERLWEDVLRKSIDEIAPQINSILIGMPVGSFGWMQYGLHAILVDLIQSSNLFAGFLISIDFSFTPEARVRVKLEPKYPLVQQAKVKVISKTLPNIYLLQLRHFLQINANKIVGLPQEYIISQKDRIKQDIINLVSSSSWRRYFLTTSVEIIPENITDIIINVDSKKYSSYLMGYIDVGREGENKVEARGYLGRKITSDIDVFLRSNLALDTLKMDITAGIGKNIHPSVFVGVECSLKEKHTDNLYILINKGKIRGNYIGDYFKKTQEVSVGYRFREFLILEIARKEKEYGGRIVIIF